MAAYCEVSLLSVFRGEPLPSSTRMQSFALPDRVEPSWKRDVNWLISHSWLLFHIRTFT